MALTSSHRRAEVLRSHRLEAIAKRTNGPGFGAIVSLRDRYERAIAVEVAAKQPRAPRGSTWMSGSGSGSLIAFENA